MQYHFVQVQIEKFAAAIFYYPKKLRRWVWDMHGTRDSDGERMTVNHSR